MAISAGRSAFNKAPRSGQWMGESAGRGRRYRSTMIAWAPEGRPTDAGPPIRRTSV